VNPVNGITELMRLLRLSGQDRVSRPTAHGAIANAESKGASAPQYESVEQLISKLKSRIQEAEGKEGVGPGPLDLFVETVLEWKFRDLDEALDLNKLAAQVRDIIAADPEVKAKLEDLLNKL
jgi:hypothetical protein